MRRERESRLIRGMVARGGKIAGSSGQWGSNRVARPMALIQRAIAVPTRAEGGPPSRRRPAFLTSCPPGQGRRSGSYFSAVRAIRMGFVDRGQLAVPVDNPAEGELTRGGVRVHPA